MQDIVNMVDNLPDIDDKLELRKEDAMTLREDVAVQGKFTRDELLKNAPKVQAGCIVVPTTVE